MARLPDSIGFVHEDDLVRITHVPRSTRQNWIKKSLVIEPEDGRYREHHVIEAVAVSQLVTVLKRLVDVRRVWDAAGEDVAGACAGATADGYLVALVEPRLLRLTLARSNEELGAALRPFETAVAVPLARTVAEARAAFWRFASTDDSRADRRRRTSAPRSASEDGVAHLRQGPSGLQT